MAAEIVNKQIVDACFCHGKQDSSLCVLKRYDEQTSVVLHRNIAGELQTCIVLRNVHTFKSILLSEPGRLGRMTNIDFLLPQWSNLLSEIQYSFLEVLVTKEGLRLLREEIWKLILTALKHVVSVHFFKLSLRLLTCEDLIPLVNICHNTEFHKCWDRLVPDYDQTPPIARLHTYLCRWRLCLGEAEFQLLLNTLTKVTGVISSSQLKVFQLVLFDNACHQNYNTKGWIEELLGDQNYKHIALRYHRALDRHVASATAGFGDQPQQQRSILVCAVLNYDRMLAERLGSRWQDVHLLQELIECDRLLHSDFFTTTLLHRLNRTYPFWFDVFKVRCDSIAKRWFIHARHNNGIVSNSVLNPVLWLFYEKCNFRGLTLAINLGFVPLINPFYTRQTPPNDLAVLELIDFLTVVLKNVLVQYVFAGDTEIEEEEVIDSSPNPVTFIRAIIAGLEKRTFFVGASRLPRVLESVESLAKDRLIAEASSSYPVPFTRKFTDALTQIVQVIEEYKHRYSNTPHSLKLLCRKTVLDCCPLELLYRPVWEQAVKLGVPEDALFYQ